MIDGPGSLWGSMHATVMAWRVHMNATKYILSNRVYIKYVQSELTVSWEETVKEVMSGGGSSVGAEYPPVLKSINVH